MPKQNNHASESKNDDPYAAARAKMAATKTMDPIRSERRAGAQTTQGSSANHTIDFSSFGKNSTERKSFGNQHHSKISIRSNQGDSSTSVFISIVSLLTSAATIFSALQGFGAAMQVPANLATLLVAPATQTNSYTPVSTMPQIPAPGNSDDSGSLDLYTNGGRLAAHCPLKHTKVNATVLGSNARVTVMQVFRNNSREKLEARYRFPLSENGAVDSMVMKIGDRIINGDIKRREEANQIYTAAKQSGYAAALLDQEKTNMFTQSIANLEPGKEIEITINYTETLAFRNGNFQFVFPTVVGPRYHPYGFEAQEAYASHGGNGFFKLATFDRTPAVQVDSQTRRPGHDIEINVDVDAGLPIQKLTSRLHKINVLQRDNRTARVSLQNSASIPNRDFVLDIAVSKEQLQTGYVASKTGDNGFLSLMLIPPKKVVPQDVAPRELIFVVDCSGSQAGRPIQKSRETLNYVIDHANSNDTFQIITFNDGIKNLFDKPEKLTLSRKLQAKCFVNDIKALGGTIMEPAVEAACESPAEENRLRIVSFMTDGYVSDDYRVIGLVKSLRGNSRWFPFGVGDSVNRTLIENIAKEGGGESDFVLLDDSADAVGKKFYDRISAPVLTDVRISADGVELLDTYPRNASDVWSEKPLFFNARYTKSGHGSINVDGFYQGKPYHQSVPVILPSTSTSGAQLGQVWARAKIDDLTSQDWEGVNSGVMIDSIKEQIVATALKYHLLSQFTSFVAVDHSRITTNAALATVDIPVSMPEGLSQNANATSNNAVSPAISQGSSFTGLSFNCTDANQKVVNSALNPIFSKVVHDLNNLSCAAASAGPTLPTSSYNYQAGPTQAQTAFNPVALALLPWAFIPAPLRALLIVFLTLIALVGARQLKICAEANEPLPIGTMAKTILWFSSAALLAFIHVSIVNFRG